jgi:hypothetical protein
VTAPARHPDPEQLAAFAAGEPEVLDPLVIRAHLDVCEACAADVQALHALDAELAQLEEPEPPPGLHDRLLAAVRAENAAALPHRLASAAAVMPDWDDGQDDADGGQPPTRPAAPVASLRERRARRNLTIRRLVWVAAAVVVLVAVVFAGQLEGLNRVVDRVAGGGPEATSGAAEGGGSGERSPRAGDGDGAVPEFRVPGEYGPDDVRRDLKNRPEARDAYDEATGRTLGEGGEGGEGAGEAAGEEAPAGGQEPGDAAAEGQGGQPGGEPQPAPPQQEQAPDQVPPDDDPENYGQPPPDVETDRQPAPSDPAPTSTIAVQEENPPANDQCFATVRADGREPLYVVQAEHEGEPATVVVAADPADPDRVWVYTFPRGDCSQPVITEKAKVPDGS